MCMKNQEKISVTEWYKCAKYRVLDTNESSA